MLVLAVLPPIYLIYRVYKLDSIEKEPRSLLLKLFFFGILSLIPTFIIETLLNSFVTNGILTAFDPVAKSLIDNLICVALVEESCKYIFLKKGSWKHPAFDYCFDAIVYSVVVSLGFAAVENIMYVFQYGVEVALLRAVTAIPGHTIFGIFMGHYYGMAKMQEKMGNIAASKSLLKKAVFVPVLLHGIYDFTASSNSGIMTLVFYAFLIILDIIAVKQIRKYSSEDTRL